ncbi:hypothetical protein [Actinoallomurus iriomotensis]|uniref:Uncharacterized protein n=1 Tax=Actinoallomurus iriomotensis TaxID=478107 RepID=A0A9W6RCA5_9ACTN|nr:hypothetical protein [Actinoallomurus iriomotensis]GLY73234.1 hypothetical protein Airi01_015010 [Actinoallomurus iriomotensis]
MTTRGGRDGAAVAAAWPPPDRHAEVLAAARPRRRAARCIDATVRRPPPRTAGSGVVDVHHGDSRCHTKPESADGIDHLLSAVADLAVIEAVVRPSSRVCLVSRP